MTIVARDVKKLQEAKAQIEVSNGGDRRRWIQLNVFQSHRISETQRIVSISADLTSQGESAKAYNDAIIQQNGLEPETVFLCAGHAKPGFFVEADERDLRSVSRLRIFRDIAHP